MKITVPFTNIPLLAAIVLAAGLTPTPTQADSYIDYAQVTKVEPIYETISYQQPHQECHLEKRTITHRKQRSTTPKVLGALIGGAIGNELGHNKSNKRVGAIAGAILGGSIANDIQHNHYHEYRRYTRPERVCHTSYSTRHEKQVSAYNVDYRYRGRTYTRVMNQHPGSRIQVAVDVNPIDY